MTSSDPPPRRRWLLLDALRGVAVVAMVVYHTFYTLAELFGSPFGRRVFAALAPVQPLIAGTFILLCGVCCRFSRSNAKRGLLLLGAALLVTLATAGLQMLGYDEVITFGVLHLLALAVLLFVPLQKPLGSRPPLPQLLLFAALFCATDFIAQQGGLRLGGIAFQLPNTDFFPLYVLGLPSRTLQSADYFPLLPWLFLFLTGTAIGIYGQQGRFPAWCAKSRAKPLQWIGRHALVIYLAHQPVIFGLCWAAEQV
ncbi:MAG: DUF1624 domain-containing protein [Oscillospiraceae bacterium]|jgi:uncharacterized membrane protein|nr:DUF1624 domain-containing protein [Oscillospiraceae bacterium]